jgi:hypothetical protein
LQRDARSLVGSRCVITCEHRLLKSNAQLGCGLLRRSCGEMGTKLFLAFAAPLLEVRR